MVAVPGADRNPVLTEVPTSAKLGFTDFERTAADPMGMRSMQKRVFDRRNSRYFRVKAPARVGRSRPRGSSASTISPIRN
jgi:hypothetical protein